METELFFENVIEFYNGPTDDENLPDGVGTAIAISGGNLIISKKVFILGISCMD